MLKITRITVVSMLGALGATLGLGFTPTKAAPIPPRYQGEWCGPVPRTSDFHPAGNRYELCKNLKDTSNLGRIELTEDKMTIYINGSKRICEVKGQSPISPNEVGRAHSYWEVNYDCQTIQSEDPLTRFQTFSFSRTYNPPGLYIYDRRYASTTHQAIIRRYQDKEDMREIYREPKPK